MDLVGIVLFFLFKGADNGPTALPQPHPVYDQVWRCSNYEPKNYLLWAIGLIWPLLFQEQMYDFHQALTLKSSYRISAVLYQTIWEHF